MDKWKTLQDELYAESEKAMKSRDLTSYFVLNKIWTRMIELDIEDSGRRNEEIKKKYNL